MQYQSFGQGLRQLLLWSCPCQCLDCILRPPICTRRTHWTASQLTILCGAGLKEGNAWTGKENQLCKKVKILFSSHRLACSYASNSTTIASYSEKEVTKCLSFTIVKSFSSDLKHYIFDSNIVFVTFSTVFVDQMTQNTLLYGIYGDGWTNHNIHSLRTWS